MRILIAGGFGFLGGRLAAHLHQAGHKVVLGSRHAAAPPEWLPHAAIATTDWGDAAALVKACARIDVIVHAAGMDAAACAADPVAALECNGLGTARLVEAARQAGVGRFIYLSTSHVYASPLAGTITEESCPRNIHPYATSHLAGELALMHASDQGPMEGVVLRLSNGFGAPMDKSANCWTIVVNDLCRQAVESGGLELRSSGLQKRDFIAVSEVCRAIGFVAECALAPAKSHVFNVGSGLSKSVLEMARLIQERCKPILGFQPELRTRAAIAGERHENLEYRVEKLAKRGFPVAMNCTAEIDALLSFCKYSFHRSTRLGP